MCGQSDAHWRGCQRSFTFSASACTKLVWHVADEVPNYFSQRRPAELGRFEWIIDAKDPLKVTSQEQWWLDVIGPLGESRSRREPFTRVRDSRFNYAAYDRAFSMQKELWHPDGRREPIDGIDIKKLISDRVSFVDSRTELLIQAADIVAGFLRRALRAPAADERVLKTIGRLTILKKLPGARAPQSIRLITLGKATRADSQVSKRILLAASTARSMWKSRRSQH